MTNSAASVARFSCNFSYSWNSRQCGTTIFQVDSGCSLPLTTMSDFFFDFGINP